MEGISKTVINKKGDYTPNNVDWVMDIADYGPGEHEKDWEQVDKDSNK